MIRAEIEKIHAVGALTHIFGQTRQTGRISHWQVAMPRYQIAEGQRIEADSEWFMSFSKNEPIEYSI